MITRILCTCVIIAGVGFLPMSPAPTNPLCYSNQAYRNTHEQECLIDQVHSTQNSPGGGGGGGGGLLGGLLGHLGGLL